MRAVPHVLYIEDNEYNQRLVKRILRPAGFQVTLAKGGPQGIKKAVDLTPDLILIDLNLPMVGGLGAATKLKSIGNLAVVPLVALAGKSTRQDRERAIIAGCDGVIEKPIDVSSFPDQLRHYLEGKRERVDQAQKDSLLREYNANLADQLQAKVEELERANRDLKASKEELQNAYEQSQQWNLELQRLNRLKENIVAITSHELRTPLSIALGYIDLVLENMVGPINEEQAEVLGIAKQSLSKMGELVGRITDLTRLALKKFPIRLEEFDVHQRYREVAAEMAYFMKIRDLTYEEDLRAESTLVRSDPHLLGDVFANLLKNAICFTPNGGTIQAKTWIQNNKVYFSIKDSGVGIDQSDLEHIFDGFYQVEDAEHHKTGQFEFMTRGIGVGLALCKGILNELGGKIWAESPGTGNGSTFTLYLPLVSNHELT